LGKGRPRILFVNFPSPTLVDKERYYPSPTIFSLPTYVGGENIRGTSLKRRKGKIYNEYLPPSLWEGGR